jgi:hypothetical protein
MPGAGRLVALVIALAIVSWFLPAAYSQARQPGAVYDFDRKGEKPAPAPRRDISGIWVPAGGAGQGTQANGAQMMPSDGKPEHELPFTPLGRQAFLEHKPSVGVTAVTPALTNDPVKGGVTGTGCDPVGFPRLALWNLRTIRIMQSPENVVVLYLLNSKWRVIRTDQQALPEEFDEPRWLGYSVGRWEDDYTFVAQSAGFDERTWIDAAGRPHSDALRVEERYKRVDRDHILLTLTIDDPKMYTKPWTALNMSLRLQSPTFDIREMECAPSENAEYNRQIANPVAGLPGAAK